MCRVRGWCRVGGVVWVSCGCVVRVHGVVWVVWGWGVRGVGEGVSEDVSEGAKLQPRGTEDEEEGEGEGEGRGARDRKC